MSEKSLISARLREFGEKKFSSMTEFAKALDMMPQTLNSYLSGAVGVGPIDVERTSRVVGKWSALLAADC
jgi:hypothetical protein